ncbi:MAG: hypothetical protein QME45_14515 [Clostridiales bacterium]|nr:hypothetical protein [Clostridiales bacterium]
MDTFDITFIGHMCFNEIIPYRGKSNVSYGGSILLSTAVSSRIGKRTAVIVKMAESDKYMLKSMRELGADVYIIPSKDTTYIKVIYPDENVDNREFVLEKNAGIIKINEMPKIKSKYVHLAGISNTEFDMDLIKHLRERYDHLSIDMQSIVRHVDMTTHKISFVDDARKKEISSLMDGIKLDIVEAKILTGFDDMEEAAKVFEGWGCPEVMITHSSGVLVRANGKTYYEKFTNKSDVGRTGRGDTTFAAYLSYRMSHNAAESTRFAAALVSIKMETPGPFSGTLEDVIARMGNDNKL